MRALRPELVRTVVAALVREFDPDRIIMFGSRIWGTPDADSDLDLLVVVPADEERSTRRAARAYRCLRGIPVPIDVLVRTRNEMERFSRVPAALESEVLQRGKVLYERGEAGVDSELAPEGASRP